MSDDRNPDSSAGAAFHVPASAEPRGVFYDPLAWFASGDTAPSGSSAAAPTVFVLGRPGRGRGITFPSREA